MSACAISAGLHESKRFVISQFSACSGATLPRNTVRRKSKWMLLNANHVTCLISCITDAFSQPTLTWENGSYKANYFKCNRNKLGKLCLMSHLALKYQKAIY